MFGVTIPLPLAAALLAGIVAVRVILVNRSFNWPNGLFALFFLLLGIQSILTSIRFSPLFQTTLPIQPVLAMLICPIAFLAFRSLRGPDSGGLSKIDILHLIPALVMAGVLILGLPFPMPIDGFIWISFLLYNILLVLEINDGPDSFERFGTEAVRVLVAARIVAVCLLLVILVYDIVIFINLEFWGGIYTDEIVAMGSVLLIAISLSILVFPITFPIPIGPQVLYSPKTDNLLVVTDEDKNIYKDLEHLMRTKRPFLDPNINITKLARQLKIPARSMSNTVNKVSRQNFSQYVNQYRVVEACSLLSNTEMPITEVMFEAGFQTKSTFNREFLARIGKSPSEYRRDLVQF